MRITIAVGLLVASVALAQSPVNEENVFAFYRDFTRLTRQPHPVAPLTAQLCTTVISPAAIEKEKGMTGPHYKTSVHLYVNPIALPVVRSRAGSFPVGAIIVKEKLGEDGKVTGVGGMIKRESGYDPANGDWEFFYSGSPGRFTSGRIENCGECHRAAKATDHVYSVWNLPE